MQVFQLIMQIDEKLGISLPLSRVNSMIAALDQYKALHADEQPLDKAQLDFAEQLRPIANQVLGISSAASPQAFLTFARKAHTLCATPLREVTPGMGLSAWLSSDRTGLSSLYLASIVAGAPQAPFAEPHDFDDLRRCAKFLIAVPEARTRLELISSHSARWALFVQHAQPLFEFVSLELQGEPIPGELDTSMDYLNVHLLSLSSRGA